jgi:hypothetical protein
MVSTKGLCSQRQRQQVADDRRLAVRRATNDFDQILAGLSEPTLPHAFPFASAIEKRVVAPPRDAQPKAPRRKSADGRAKAVAHARDHDVAVSTEFRDPSAEPPPSVVHP